MLLEVPPFQTDRRQLLVLLLVPVLELQELHRTCRQLLEHQNHLRLHHQTSRHPQQELHRTHLLRLELQELHQTRHQLLELHQNHLRHLHRTCHLLLVACTDAGLVHRRKALPPFPLQKRKSKQRCLQI